MKVVTIFFFVLYFVALIGQLAFLAQADYPRTLTKSRAEDALRAFLIVVVVIWLLWVLATERA